MSKKMKGGAAAPFAPPLDPRLCSTTWVVLQIQMSGYLGWLTQHINQPWDTRAGLHTEI